MKHRKKFFACMLSCACIFMSGCANENKKVEEVQTVKTFNGDTKEYCILGLNLGDKVEKVVEAFGEPLEKCYEVVGTFQVTDQSLYTFSFYEDMIVTTRNFFDEQSYEDQNGIVEVDIYGGDYQTQKGVKVGDTLDHVVEQYEIKGVFNYEKDSEDDIVRLIYNRVNSLEGYEKRDFMYDYGEIDKVAYIISDQRDVEHDIIPALIFLIKDDKVTHIIVSNTTAL